MGCPSLHEEARPAKCRNRRPAGRRGRLLARLPRRPARKIKDARYWGIQEKSYSIVSNPIRVSRENEKEKRTPNTRARKEGGLCRGKTPHGKAKNSSRGKRKATHSSNRKGSGSIPIWRQYPRKPALYKQTKKLSEVRPQRSDF